MDFEEAFYKARSLVEEWEKAQKISPSEPQIKGNTRVTEYIKRWLESEKSQVSDSNPSNSPVVLETGP